GAAVIPSGAPKARRRGIAIIPVERPPGRDECDSSPSLGMTLGGRRRDEPNGSAPRVAREHTTVWQALDSSARALDARRGFRDAAGVGEHEIPVDQARLVFTR